MRAASRAAFAAAVAATYAVSSHAFGPGAAESSTPRLVRVDVIASDARGRIVENLKATDFAITENASPQLIDGLQFVKADGAVPNDAELNPIRSEFDEQEEAARPGTRLFALFLDEYHVSAANTGRVRDVLTAFVDRDLGPRDLIAVLKPLDSLLTIRVTRDRDVVRHAIETFDGRKGDYEPRTAFERDFIGAAPARVDQVRAQVATSALNALAVHIGKLGDGRKSILLVSEGFPRPAHRRGFEGLPTIDSVVRSASRYNVSVYAFNPQETDGVPEAATGAPSDAATLAALADGTDGRAAEDDAPLRQMVADSSAYYVLTYRSSQPNDGKFRDVQVRVNRTGVRVRARKGYWGLWPDEARAAELLAKASEPVRAALPAAFSLPWRSSPLIRPWFGLSRGEAGRTRVTFAWEPAPRVPGDRSRAGAPARIVMTALAPDGSELFSGVVCAANASSCDASRAIFDVPPGRVRLQMSIQDAAEQVIDSDVREIAVRDLKGPVALGTAEILRTRTAREFRAIAAAPSAPPTAAREFSRTERLIVRVAAYAPDGNPRVAIRLANRIGQTLRDLDVTRAPAPDSRFQVDLPLANLAPGEYYFEVSASSASGEAKDLIGFRVTN
jgi:VWFA-related protein